MKKQYFEKLDIYKNGYEIVNKLQQSGFVAYFVGGAVRDMVLGKKPKDIDIVTSALPENVLQLFPDSKLVGACFGVVNIPVDHVHYEVATFREERDYEDGRHPLTVKYTTEPAVDAQRRDFTINGLYYDPVSDEIHDFVGGVNDVKKGVIRAIGKPEERFAEDYLRMLRAVRFAVRLGFELDCETEVAIKQLVGKLALLSAERVREELNRMLTGVKPEKALILLKNLGALHVILPEVVEMDGVPQPEKFHPEGDVLTHTLIMLQHMAYPDVELAWALLLHDISKPETLIYGEDGAEHFYGHEEKGAEKAKGILSRLAFPNKSTDNICHAIRNHMRFAHVHQMREAKLRRLIAEPTFALELELHRIDCMSCHGRLQNYHLLLDKVNELKNEITLPEPVLTGKDLIDLGLEPGPMFGKILNDIMNLQLEGRIREKADAISLVKKSYL